MSTSDPHSVPEALERALRDLGRRLSENPDRVRAVLSDSLGAEARSHRAEIDAVVVASEEGVPATLIDRSEVAATETDTAAGDRRLLDRLAERGLNPDAAAFALGTWAGALGTATSVTSTPMIEATSSGSLDPTGGSLDPTGAADESALEATTMPRDTLLPAAAAGAATVAAAGAATAGAAGPGAGAGVGSGTRTPPAAAVRGELVHHLSRRAVAGAAAAVLVVVAAAVWGTVLRDPDVDLQLADGALTSTTTTSAPATTTTAAPTTRAQTTTKPPPTTKKATPPKSSTTPPKRSSSSTPPKSSSSSTPPRSSSTSKKTTPPPPPPAPKTLKAGSTTYSYSPKATNDGVNCLADAGLPAEWCRSRFPAIKTGTVTTWSVTSAYSQYKHGNVTISGHDVYYTPHHNGAFTDVVYYRISGSGVTSNWGSFTVNMSCNTNYQCF